MIKDEFIQKMIDTKFSRYLLKVSNNIKFKISVSQASSNYNRARISMIIINECADYMLKKMNEIAQLNNSKTSNTKLEKYSFSDMMKWIAIHTGSQQTSLLPSVLINLFISLNLNTIAHKIYCKMTRYMSVASIGSNTST